MSVKHSTIWNTKQGIAMKGCAARVQHLTLSVDFRSAIKHPDQHFQSCGPGGVRFLPVLCALISKPRAALSYLHGVRYNDPRRKNSAESTEQPRNDGKECLSIEKPSTRTRNTFESPWLVTLRTIFSSSGAPFLDQSMGNVRLDCSCKSVITSLAPLSPTHSVLSKGLPTR